MIPDGKMIQKKGVSHSGRCDPFPFGWCARVYRDSATTFGTADVGVRGKKLLQAQHFTPSIDRGGGLGGGLEGGGGDICC